MRAYTRKLSLSSVLSCTHSWPKSANYYLNMYFFYFFTDSCYQIEIPKLNASFTGTGDLFAALFLAWTHKSNKDLKITLEKTVATLQYIVKDTYYKARGKY